MKTNTLSISDIQQVIKDSIHTALSKLEIEHNINDIELTRPQHSRFGELSTNVSLKFAKTSSTAPLTFAKSILEQIQDSIPDNIFDSITIEKPGFINFFIKEEVLASTIKHNLLENGTKQKQKIVIDYSSPNIAKRFSIGHLRSTIIGNSIDRLYKKIGWEVISDNHLGDWGTQFGQLIVAVKKWANKSPEKLSIQELESLYVQFNKEAETHSELFDEARNAFKQLENNDPESRDIWQKIVNSSMKEFQSIYELLDVTLDHAYGESFYESMIEEITNDCLKSPFAIESAGATIFDHQNEAIPPAMIKKTDGTSTYFIRDLAAIKFRVQKWNPDLIVYEVGSEQKLHFTQVFDAAEKLGYIKKDQLVHIPHGLISLPEGKMSTRKGRTVKLEDVINQAKEKVSELNNDPEDINTIAIGAIKYNDLKRSPNLNYIFKLEDAINLDGNSSPYLQYTEKRIQSLLENNVIQDYQVTNINAEEKALIMDIHDYNRMISEAATSFNPSVVANYLHTLAQTFNSFYAQHKINVEDSSTKMFRLHLSSETGKILVEGLSLLGINIPKSM